jgi:transcriptional regulator with XRE-family HTH domain
MPRTRRALNPTDSPPASPDFADLQPVTAAEPQRVEYALYYELDPAFGSFIKSLREARGLSLRVTSAHLGVPFSYIQRLETGGRAAKPELPLLERLAALYGVAASEMENRAGVRREPLRDPERLVHEQFRVLALHPNWRSPGMTEEWLESFSVKQKRQIIQMLRQLGEQMKAGSASPNEVLAEAGLLIPGPA